MTGKMEAGEGRGGPSKEGSPFLPKLPERFASLPEAFRLVGRRRGGAVGWGWGKVRQIFMGKALSEYVAVSSPQYGENTAFLSVFPLGWIHG